MMRILLGWAIATTVLAGAAAAITPPSEPAPEFHGKALDGEKFSNESLRGKTVLIQFWATWCSYCRRDQPAVDAMVREFGGSGLVVLAVNVGESRKTVMQYLQGSPRACSIALASDTNLAALFSPKSFPLYVVIDKGGNLSGTQNGSGGEDALRTLLRAAGLGSK
jgi:thiol-disulfide isomerase/thioredoxin